MLYTRSIASLLAFLSVSLAQTSDPDLVAKLKTAPSNIDRINLLRDDQFVFNFLSKDSASVGSAGTTTTANSRNFPAVINNGVAMTYGYLEPCGLNTPHTHPRATEINIAINGTLRTGMLAENGARFVFNNVPAGSVTVFPQGVIHFEMNTECEPTLFVAGFNHEDPGTLAIGQRFFGLPPDIVQASLDSIGIVEIAGLEAKIPNNVAFGVEECLKRCGITKGTQPTTQRQPRVAGNALPDGFSGPAAPAPAAPAASGGAHSDLSGMFNKGDMMDNTGDPKFNAALATPDLTNISDKNVRTYLIALLAINGSFVIVILAAIFVCLVRRKGGNKRVRDAHMPQFAPLREEKDVEYYDPYNRSASPLSGKQ